MKSNLFKYIAKAGIHVYDRVLGARFLEPFQGLGIILQYHSVGVSEQSIFSYVHPSLSLDRIHFARQMAYIRRHFHVVPLDTLLARLETGDRLHEPLVSITFDDGYQDNFLHAYPVLKKLSLPATFYLTTDCIGNSPPLWTSELRYLLLKTLSVRVKIPSLGMRLSLNGLESRLRAIRDLKVTLAGLSREPREGVLEEVRTRTALTAPDRRDIGRIMLTWDQVQKMAKGGMTFGAHTRSHPSLPSIGDLEAEQEIVGSREMLENRLGQKVLHFSYPNPGDIPNFDMRIRQMVHGAGYASAVTSVQGRVLPADDPLTLRRKGIYRIYKRLPEFHFQIWKEALQAWISSYRRTAH